MGSLSWNRGWGLALVLSTLAVLAFSAVVVVQSFSEQGTISASSNMSDLPLAAETPSNSALTNPASPAETADPTPEPVKSIMPSVQTVPTIGVDDPLTQAPALDRSEPVAPLQEAPHSCPSGILSAGLTEVSFAPSNNGYDQSVITARGWVRNGTSAQILLFDDDVPNFEGLNYRGERVIIELFGKWDWAPPLGTPNPGVLTIEPGQTLTYTITDKAYNSTINEVLNWYTAAEAGSLNAYFNDAAYSRCPHPLAPAGKGISIPATNLPPVQP